MVILIFDANQHWYGIIADMKVSQHILLVRQSQQQLIFLYSCCSSETTTLPEHQHLVESYHLF